ncbi:hypothetical protein OC846_004680 [Tilletia horrida]|uniref:tRNA (guanine(10)-N(2))-methyltransferase n=1 Tax=Tilletia horrida TaxID=155126 RepID=A0AAN6GLU2_9BASI|nr:hypothetical protein OC846_004680 [Tilletia horrida]KAK0554646.1 hypothetical protein OC845_000678 [Tilletia horrida]KAK0563262.1 hypothetical protein OC861_004902 [Tilletia horrida]
MADGKAGLTDLYIVHFSSSNLSFRIPDWEATCTSLNIPYAFIPTPVSFKAQDIKGKQKASPQEDEPSLYDPYTVEQTPVPWHPPEFDHKPNTDPRKVSCMHLVWLPSDDAAKAICNRSTQVKAIYSYWSSALSYPDLHRLIQSQPRSVEKCEQFRMDTLKTSWKANFLSINHAIDFDLQIEKINSFSFFNFTGPVSLKRPHREWVIIEEHNFGANQEEAHQNNLQSSRDLQGKAAAALDPKLSDGEPDSPPLSSSKERRADRDTLIQIFVGCLVCEGVARDLIIKMDLKKRVYIGNTSMPAEQSLLMANLALARPGKIIHDPFAGTGSILYACAQYGSAVIGSDIDARMLKGKDFETKGDVGINRAANQYGLQHLVLDGLGADMTQHPWRRGGLFDAIVADPPYGIRAGAKRLGRRDIGRQREEPFQFPDGRMAHELPDYIAPTRPYHLLDLCRDLLDYAQYLLVPGGRLVFWLPCVNEEDGKDVEIPSRAGMKFIACSTQDFGRWSRMLITLEKLPKGSAGGNAGTNEGDGRIGRLTRYGQPIEYPLLPSSSGVGGAADATNSAVDPTGVSTANGNESAVPSHPPAPVMSTRYQATADSNEFRNRVYRS